MRRLRWTACLGLFGLTLALNTTHSPAQFPSRGGGGGLPGGGGGGMRGMPSPEERWADYQRRAGSTGDTLDLSRLPADVRQKNKWAADNFGTEPLPEAGIMTKADFLAMSDRNTAKIQSRMGGMGGPRPGGPAAPGSPLNISLSPNNAPPGGPPAFPAPGGPPMGPGRGGERSSEDRALERMKEQDKDGDGKVSKAEADRKLLENFDRIDVDRDGFITLDEYRGYYASRDNGRGGPPGGPGGPPGGPGGPPMGPGGGYGGYGGYGENNQQGQKRDTEEAKPVAMRYGYLPKDLPGWYDESDGDKDGQVALHEWRKAGKDLAEFQRMDLNSDGLVTADELLRFNRNETEKAKIAALTDPDAPAAPSRPSFAGGRGNSGGGGFALPGSAPPSGAEKVSATNDKSADKGSSDKGGGSNPFRMGGGPGGFGKKGKN